MKETNPVTNRIQLWPGAPIGLYIDLTRKAKRRHKSQVRARNPLIIFGNEGGPVLLERTVKLRVTLIPPLQKAALKDERLKC